MEMVTSPKKIRRIHPKKFALWTAIVSMLMLFSAFTSAYIVSKGDGFWVNFNLPNAFWISTALIIVSSITVYLATLFAKKQNKKSIYYETEYFIYYNYSHSFLCHLC